MLAFFTGKKEFIQWIARVPVLLTSSRGSQNQLSLPLIFPAPFGIPLQAPGFLGSADSMCCLSSSCAQAGAPWLGFLKHSSLELLQPDHTRLSTPTPFQPNSLLILCKLPTSSRHRPFSQLERFQFLQPGIHKGNPSPSSCGSALLAPAAARCAKARCGAWTAAADQGRSPELLWALPC